MIKLNDNEQSIVHEKDDSESSDSEGKYKSELKQLLEEQSGVKKDKKKKQDSEKTLSQMGD